MGLSFPDEAGVHHASRIASNDLAVESVQNGAHRWIYIISRRSALWYRIRRTLLIVAGWRCIVRMTGCRTWATVTFVDATLHVKARASHNLDGTADRFVCLTNLPHPEACCGWKQERQLTATQTQVYDVLQEVAR